MPRLAASFLLALVGIALAVTSAGPGPGGLAAAEGERVPLPRALAQNGFGEPAHPIRVEFVGPVGEAADHPRLLGSKGAAPAGTLWVFENPRPVLEILGTARTRAYEEGRFPGAIARLRIDASHGAVRRVIHLHYRPGHGDIAVRRGAARVRGGGWTFDPAADRALVALLSKTKPQAVGVPAEAILQLRRNAARPGEVPFVWTIDSERAWRDARATLSFRYPDGNSWALPPSFDWSTHLLLGVELPVALTGKRLDWSEARVRDGVLTWRVRRVKEDRPGLFAKGGSVVVGAFARVPGLTRIRARFDDGTVVETKAPPAPKAAAARKDAPKRDAR